MIQGVREKTTLTAVAIGLVIWAHASIPDVISFSFVLLVLCAAVALSACSFPARQTLVAASNTAEVEEELRQLEVELHSQMDQHRTDEAAWLRRQRELNARSLCRSNGGQ